MIKLEIMIKRILSVLIFTIFCVIITPWFTNNRGVIVDFEKEQGFQRDAEVLVISKLATQMSEIDTGGFSLGRLGPLTKTEINTWGNPDPYQALNEKSAQDFIPYVSQFGLQSIIYSNIYPVLVKLTGNIFNLTDLRFIITFLFVIVNLLIFITLYKSVNKPFALIWIITMFCSPFVLLFSRNLYWASFSYYLPILFSIYYSNSKKYKNYFLLLIILSLIFRFLIGYEFYTFLIISCVFFCNINKLFNNFEFNFQEQIIKSIKLLLYFLFTFIISINIHSILSPLGFFKNISFLLERSNARLTTSDQPISYIFSTLESYFLNWPKNFGWPIWYSENNLLVLPFPLINKVEIPGYFTYVIILMLIIYFIVSTINKQIIKNRFLLLFILLAPISWIILYPNHENEHGFDFYLMFFGTIQIMFFLICDLILKSSKKLYNLIRV